MVPLGPGDHENTLGFYQNELDLHTKLSDFSNVVHLYDVHVIPWGGVSLLVLAMELADGGSLRNWLTRNQGDKETRRRDGLAFFVQACHGYQAIHPLAVHLDTKPENLLFVNGVLKVSDLGAAHLLARGGADVSFLEESSSLELGTPIYMSPEQFQVAHPDDLDLRSDIYSLGVVLYEILSEGGRPPFAGSLDRIRDCHLRVRPAPIRGIQPHLQIALDKCLAKDVEVRFQTVKELIEALSPPQKPKTARKSKRRRRPRVSIEDKYQRALSLFQRGDFSRAARIAEEILNQQQDNSQARELLGEIQERYRQADRIYSEASTLIDAGRMADSVNHINKAMEAYPDHPSAGSVLTKAKMHSERFADCMANAIGHAKRSLGYRSFSIR